MQSREEKLRKAREYSRRWRADNRERVRRQRATPEAKERVRQQQSTPEAKERRRQALQHRVARNRELVAEFKGRCAICGRADPRCLDIHHVGPKSFNISHGIAAGSSVERMRAGLANCTCLCANCHRIEHAKLEARAAREEAESREGGGL